FHNAQTLGLLQLLLIRSLDAHLLADRNAQAFNIHFSEQFLDALGAHHGDEFAGELHLQLALLLVGDHFGQFEVRYFTRIHNDIGFKVENPLQFAEGDIEQVANTAGQSLEKPHVGTRAGQFDMAKAFAADAGKGDFDATLVANYAAVLHSLVLAAQAFPVSDGSKNSGAEQSI